MLTGKELTVTFHAIDRRKLQMSNKRVTDGVLLYFPIKEIMNVQFVTSVSQETNRLYYFIFIAKKFSKLFHLGNILAEKPFYINEEKRTN